MKNQPLTQDTIIRISRLASLPLDEEQIAQLADQVGVTVGYVSALQKLSTQGAAETSQVTKMENIFREDQVDTHRGLSQKQALSNAKRTHNGFFVVDAIFGE